jgi:hypothetical protein
VFSDLDEESLKKLPALLRLLRKQRPKAELKR